MAGEMSESGARCPADAATYLRGWQRGCLLLEHLGERLVRARRLLIAGTEEYPTAVRVHLGCELGDEAALPDASLTGDHCDLRLPIRGA